jgi:hypothetical protein
MRRKSRQAGAMIYIVINALPIALATVLGLLIGQFVDRPKGITGWLVALPATAWLCAILAGALILAPPRAPPWVMTIATAWVIWIGFVVPALAASLVMAGQRWGRVGRACLWWLVVMMVQVVVMKLVGLTPPPV